MKNAADIRGFYPPRPSASVDYTLLLTTALSVLPLLLISHWFECRAFGFQPLNNLLAAALKEVMVICDVNYIVGEALKGLNI